MESRLKTRINKLPTGPGVYEFFNRAGELIYVGKSVSIKKRVSSYFASKGLGQKTNQMVAKIAKVEYIKVFSEFEALMLEADLIRTNKPFYNIQAKDDKSPIYITISKEEIPIVDVVRKTNLNPHGQFIKGPFPSAKATREILRNIRRIFPYCHHRHPKKPCLFVHLGLCPYPYRDEHAKEEYIKNIKKIKTLLSGKNKELVRELKKDMQNFAKNEQFEQAQRLRDQLQKLEYIISVYRTPREFLEQPTLVDDLNHMRLKDLKGKLNLKKLPKRIECFDISNISGKQATGSMVAFIGGKPDKSEYRRFRIKFKHTPDDFEMMREVIARRFKNPWPDPDLMIIDGGRGQLSAAVSIAKKYKKQITIVSLAKRLEEIYTAGQDLPISLPKESPARQLAQAIRDEAHRFAITYHRLLRSKDFIKRG